MRGKKLVKFSKKKQIVLTNTRRHDTRPQTPAVWPQGSYTNLAFILCQDVSMGLSADLRRPHGCRCNTWVGKKGWGCSDSVVPGNRQTTAGGGAKNPRATLASEWPSGSIIKNNIYLGAWVYAIKLKISNILRTDSKSVRNSCSYSDADADLDNNMALMVASMLPSQKKHRRQSNIT